jgi:hypothetical protein
MKPAYLSRIWLLLAVLLLTLYGCAVSQANQLPDPSTTPAATARLADTPVPSATLQPQPTFTSEPPAAPTTAATPTTVVHPQNGWKGWQVYTNPDYGFTFQYPPGWRLEEPSSPKGESTLKGHAVWLVPDTTADARMQVAFKRSSEDIPLGRTGLGSGELVPWGKVVLLGIELEKQVLVLEGKHMTIMYRYPAGANPGNLVFNIDVDYLGEWTGATALTDGVEANADEIVASIALTSNP